MEEQKKNNSYWARLPIILALTMSCGIFIGAKMFGSNTPVNDILKSSNKFRDIINYINNDYVDSVNTEELTEEAINGMLAKLDPHSVYIPPKDIEIAKSQLEGDFEGIGVEFQIYKDTLFVVAPISGGPSEAAGVQAADKIIKVDGKNIAGTKLATQDVYKLLRGKKGTLVKLTVMRRGVTGLHDYTITRDKIPTFSVDVGYMVDPITGYIKVNRFAANTFNEFKSKLIDVKAKGAKRLILDLRGNPGGYMDRATRMADEFLSGNKMIVFTKGKQSGYNSEIRASYPGIFESGAVIILIDEGSASASEIVSGALQDNDRALIVGRRSFGKGLVQMPINLGDNSELRLTISRYYTPSGRSIQKPYEKGHGDEYNMDIINRYKNGEFFSADSIKFKGNKKYKTLNGRTVYGGGGIMPDYFIPRDTSMFTPYLNKLFNKGIIRDYVLDYNFVNKKNIEKMLLPDFVKSFNVTDKMLADLNKLAAKDSIKVIPKEFERSKSFVKNQIKAQIARSIWRNEGYYQVFLQDDEVFLQAMKLFDKAEAIENSK